MTPRLRAIAALSAFLLACGFGWGRDDAEIIVGEWAAAPNQAGGAWTMAVSSLVFEADGTGVEQGTFGGNAYVTAFNWRIDESTRNGGITISLGGLQAYDILLDVLSADEIRISNPGTPAPDDRALAELVTFNRLDSSPDLQPEPAGPAVAEFSYIQPVVGTVAQYTGEMTVTVLESTADGETLVEQMSRDLGQELIRTLYGIDWLEYTYFDSDNAAVRTTFSFDRALLADAWPLTPGYQTAYTSLERTEDGAITGAQATLSVGEFTQATVPMGTFEACTVTLTIDYGGEVDDRIVYDLTFADGIALPVSWKVSSYYDQETPAVTAYEMTEIYVPGQ